MKLTEKQKIQFRKKWKRWQGDWVAFSKECLRVRLSEDQERALRAIQTDRRVSICSGTAFGKDFLASVASVCFLYLTPGEDSQGVWQTSTVINTGPSDRQVKNIMMREIRARINGSLLPKLTKLGVHCGVITSDMVKFPMPKQFEGNKKFANMANWYMLAFKADDHNTEAWTGFHNKNIMIVATEASGLSNTLFEGMEGCLQGNSRFVLVHNPNKCTGEAYSSMTDPQYTSFRFSSLDLPNVINGARLFRGEITKEEYNQLEFPGQVDFEWVWERLHKKGWTMQIKKEDMDEAHNDFEFNGEYFRPSEICKIKILGEHHDTGDQNLIPISWLAAAKNRWLEHKRRTDNRGIRGVDVAGLGTDQTVMIDRDGDYIFEPTPIPVFNAEAVHANIAQTIKKDAHNFKSIFVDAIGEGSGVWSRCKEIGLANVYSYKNSYGAKGLTDSDEIMLFSNLRNYTYWEMRQFFNPQYNKNAMIPDDEELIAELSDITYKRNGEYVIIEPKDDIKKRTGKSPDKADALAQTFAPRDRCIQAIEKKKQRIRLGLM